MKFEKLKIGMKIKLRNDYQATVNAPILHYSINSLDIRHKVYKKDTEYTISYIGDHDSTHIILNLGDDTNPFIVALDDIIQKIINIQEFNKEF